jgi:hypothetical protein
VNTASSHPPEVGAGSVPILLLGNMERACVSTPGPWGQRLSYYDRIPLFRTALDREPVAAVVIETRDADGFPVPLAIRDWVERHPQVPVVVCTAGGRSALMEMLDLAVAGGDVRLVLCPRDDLGRMVEHLIAPPTPPHPGAVPALLRHVVAAAPSSIRPELTLAAYHAWPSPSVHRWADALQVTRQALNARLAIAGCATASAVLDLFSAAEIAIRCTLGMRLRGVAASMGRSDDRSLRRRLGLLGARPEHLRDGADFRTLLPLISAGLRRLR